MFSSPRREYRAALDWTSSGGIARRQAPMRFVGPARVLLGRAFSRKPLRANYSSSLVSPRPANAKEWRSTRLIRGYAQYALWPFHAVINARAAQSIIRLVTLSSSSASCFLFSVVCCPDALSLCWMRQRAGSWTFRCRTSKLTTGGERAVT